MTGAANCRAQTRGGQSCKNAAMPNGRCRMHGGMSPGAPKGNKNALKHGEYTAQNKEIRRLIVASQARVRGRNYSC